MKKIYTLFLLVVCFIAFAGCDKQQLNSAVLEKNAYRIERQVQQDGTISLSYIFPVYSDMLADNFTKEEISVYKFYLASYINALAKANVKDDRNIVVSTCNYDENIDGFGFKIKFNNINIQKQFFASKNQEENNLTKIQTKGFFIKKIIIKTQFPIASKKVAGDLKMVSLLAISSWARECEIDDARKQIVLDKLNQAKYIYDFSVYGEGIYSSVMYQENGFSHNVFVKTFEELDEDNTITFYTKTVDKGLVYITITCLVCLGVMIALIVLKYKEKHVK